MAASFAVGALVRLKSNELRHVNPVYVVADIIETDSPGIGPFYKLIKVDFEQIVNFAGNHLVAETKSLIELEESE